MNPEQSHKLVKQTFQADFDRERFVDFIDKLLKRVDFKKQFKQSGLNIVRAFIDKVNSFERVGQYTDADGKKIDILIVNLKKDLTLERGRTGLRNFAAHYLQSDRGAGKSAVLIAYVSNTETDWRFSYVTLEKELQQDEQGRFQETLTNLTPARRYSFLVGKNENSHTAQKQFFELLNNPAPKLQSVDDAFNIEKVTKEFFAEYKLLFEKVRNELDNLCEKNKAVRHEFIDKGMCVYSKDEDGEELLDRNGNRIKEPFTDDFAKKLLGQIVFLYFLQKKGWFGVERDSQWGTGDKNFLRTLFSANSASANFFDSVLEPLFYNALAVKREHDWSDRFNCKIPFLNGGLFEPLNNYDWVHIELQLPNSLFSNADTSTQGDRGTGILDVFDRYNFTINEAEPLEVEVAVDPEMLGKIFENLLPENIRHGSGTYYTPRVIVTYMCQQSLINYLSSQLNEVPREDLEAFVRFGSQQRDYTEARTQSQSEKFLPQSVIENATSIEEKLKQITVCDPAIGSGAFPVGMMLEIVKAREALQAVEHIERLSQYELKRQTIENSLYGVDIDSGAVEIAKLRLWLSLIVDEAEFKTIEPLPNLDYKIMQGNSLLDEFHGVKLIDENLFLNKKVDKEARLKELDSEVAQLTKDLGTANVGKQSKLYELTSKGIAELLKKRKMVEDGTVDNLQSSLFAPVDESHQKLDDLKRKHNQIFDETRKDVKERLRREAETLEWQFIEAKLRADDHTDKLEELETQRNDRRKDYFLWQLNFPEVFERGGFDVVIGNPPYVRQEEIKESKPALKRNFETFTGTADLFVYFYEKSWQILKNYGSQAFITSNKFFRASYGEKLRRFLQNNTHLKQIIDFGDAPVFEAAAYPSILIWEKSKSENPEEVRVLPWTRGDSIRAFEQIFLEHSFYISQKDLLDDGWRLERRAVLDLLTKLRSSGTPLGEYVNGKFYRGIITGLNEAFVVNQVTYERLVKEDRKSVELLKPFLRGRDVKRWGVTSPSQWLIFTKHGVDINKYPAIKSHLSAFKSQLEPTGKKDAKTGKSLSRKLGSYQWFEIQDNIAYWKEFEQPKIIYPNICKRNEFAWDDKNFYSNQKAFIIPRASKFLLAVLNSRVVLWLFEQLLPKLQHGFFEPSKVFIERFPIPKATEAETSAIEQLVDQILKRKGEEWDADVSRLERDIDEHVFRLYGLSKGEISLIKEETPDA